MPRKQDLPEALAPLSRRNAVELSETRFHSDVSRLIDAIEKARALPEDGFLKAIAAATAARPFENSLGMKFVPVSGTKVLFSIWDTRVQDFRAYAREVGYMQSGGIYVVNVKKNDEGEDSQKWELDEKASWERPGFEQGEDHPVVGVSWDEAKAFCSWLTEKDRKAGKIGQDEEYRLPTDEEWSAAVGESKYPWGNAWPPPEGAGNYADDALMAKRSGKGWSQVPGNDGYAATSPVANFKANPLGLYDIGGNVWQWCEDWYRADMNKKALLDKYPYLKDEGDRKRGRVQRGASWHRGDPDTLLSSWRAYDTPDNRDSVSGFRCVLAGRSSQ